MRVSFIAMLMMSAALVTPVGAELKPAEAEVKPLPPLIAESLRRVPPLHIELGDFGPFHAFPESDEVAVKPKDSPVPVVPSPSPGKP